MLDNTFVLRMPWATFTVRVRLDVNERKTYEALWSPPLSKRHQSKIGDLLDVLTIHQTRPLDIERIVLCLEDASATVRNSRPRIQRIVDRMHVSSTTDEAMDVVMNAMDPAHRWMLVSHPTMWKRTREIVDRRLATNRREYRWVMGGCR